VGARLTSLGVMTAVVAVVSLAAGPSARQAEPASKPSQPRPSAKPGWSPPRTPWGDPDVAGIFTTDDELGVPFERPEQFAGREFVTEEEFKQRSGQLQRQADADSEEFVVPRASGGPEGGGTGPPSHWLERGKPSRRTSIVVDPADGRIP
jgi:hypothetical protein